jgi:hypothetical protein
MRKSFSFEGNQIHRINQVPENHKYVIQVGHLNLDFQNLNVQFSQIKH